MLPLDNFGRLRLLPASIPLRFFGTAALFHLIGWILLGRALADGGAPGAFFVFARGPGPALAALHAWTLGTLTMTAVAVALQALPVLTAQPAGSVRIAAFVWWVLGVGVTGLVGGLAASSTGIAAAGAGAVVVALLVFASRVAVLLRRARRAAATKLAVGCALLGLVGMLATGGPLASRLAGWLPGVPEALRAAHPVLAAYGFLGVLALGLSARLIPMFLLVRGIPEHRQRWTIGVVAASVGGFALALFVDAPRSIGLLAALPGAAASVLHAAAMLRAIAHRRARDPMAGVPLLQVAWFALPASVPLGLAAAWGAGGEGGRQAFVALLVQAGLLGLAIGLMARILPFLVSAHLRFGALGGSRDDPAIPAGLRRTAGAGHLIASVLLPAGLAIGSVPALWGAIAAGVAGAFAMLLAFLVIARRLRLSGHPDSGTGSGAGVRSDRSRSTTTSRLPGP